MYGVSYILLYVLKSIQNSLVVVPAKKRVPIITSLEFKTNVRGLIRTGRAVPLTSTLAHRPQTIQPAMRAKTADLSRFALRQRSASTIYRNVQDGCTGHSLSPLQKSIRTTNNPQHFDQSLAALLLQHVYNCGKHRTNKTQIQTDTRRHINLRKLTFGYNLDNCQFCEHNKGFSGEKKLY